MKPTGQPVTFRLLWQSYLTAHYFHGKSVCRPDAHGRRARRSHLVSALGSGGHSCVQIPVEASCGSLGLSPLHEPGTPANTSLSPARHQKHLVKVRTGLVVIVKILNSEVLCVADVLLVRKLLGLDLYFQYFLPTPPPHHLSCC